MKLSHSLFRQIHHALSRLALVAVLGSSAVSSLPAAPLGDSVPEGLAPTDWAGIREAHVAWKHRFVEIGDETFSATNPGQRWRTVFDGRGFLTEPRDHAWRWGLELTGYGLGEHRRPISGKAEAAATGARLSYHWDDTMEEWFRNDGRGLEQGWTLRERPAGAADEKLHLDLAVRGDLRPVVGGEGRSVQFVGEDGTTALTYGGLKAWDATGRPLPARFIANDADIAVTVDDRGAAYPITIDPIAQQAYLKASNTGAGDNFGSSVSVSGDTVVVGALGEDSNTTGVDSTPDDDGSANNSGAAYVFIRSGTTWSQQAYLKASNTGAGDQFGASVAVSGDTVVVGASYEDSDTTGVDSTPDDDGSANNSGAAFVFTRSGVTWSQQAYLKASNTGANDNFGTSVAVSGDTVVVGANGEASNSTGVDSTPDDDGSANSSGAAYVFTRSGVTWSQQAYLKASNTGASDLFGYSVAVSGDTAVVGAYGEDSNTTGVDSTPDDDGSANQSGAAYVFTRSGVTWSQQAYLKPSNTGAGDQFGISVAVSGDTAVVGGFAEDSNTTGVDSTPDDDGSANSSGAAYVFTRSGATWSQQAYLKASNTGAGDQFGVSVAVSGDTVVVGAFAEDSNTTGVDSTPDDDGSANNSGAAYVFARSGTTWSQQAYLKASNTGAGDTFGYSVAVSGDTVVVGAYGEGSNSTGVDSTPNDDGSANFSGAAYVFTIPSSPPTLRVTGRKSITTSKQRITLKGTAADADGDLLRVEARDTRPGGARKYRSARGSATNWRYKAQLRSGRNTLKIRAVDATGKTSRVTRVEIKKR